jgi:hypothetical protein
VLAKGRIAGRVSRWVDGTDHEGLLGGIRIGTSIVPELLVICMVERAEADLFVRWSKVAWVMREDQKRVDLEAKLWG